MVFLWLFIGYIVMAIIAFLITVRLQFKKSHYISFDSFWDMNDENLVAWFIAMLLAWWMISAGFIAIGISKKILKWVCEYGGKKDE